MANCENMFQLVILALEGPTVKSCFHCWFSGPNVAWLNYIPDGSEMATSEKLFKFDVFRT